MSDFAITEEHCRLGFDRVSGRLPTGFIAPDWYQAWLVVMRQGGAFDWRTRTTLAALLPTADEWPDLAPVCSSMADEAPADLLLRSVAREASALDLAQRRALVSGVMPWRRFVIVDDPGTCPEHRALHGLIRRFDDPFWARFDAEFWWGCRCTSTTMNARTAQRRGFVLPA